VLTDDELDQILDAVDHEAAPRQLFLRCRIPPLCSCREYPQGRCTSLVQRDTTKGTNRVFTQTRSENRRGEV
jgi:hypothetical protein